MQLILDADDLAGGLKNNLTVFMECTSECFKESVQEVLWMVGEAEFWEEKPLGNLRTHIVKATKWGLTKNQISILESKLSDAFPNATGIEIEEIDERKDVRFNYEPPIGGQITASCSVEYRAVGDTLEDVKVNGTYPPRSEERKAALLCSYALEGVKDNKSIAEKLLNDRSHWLDCRIKISCNPLRNKEAVTIVDNYHNLEPL